MKPFDFAIIGGGAAAFAAAIKADELNAKAVMINHDLPLGGTCVNVGCVPSKAMLYPGEVVQLLSKHNIKGLPVAPLFKNGRGISFKELIEEELSIVEKARREKYINVLSRLENVAHIEGKARFVSPDELEVNDRKIFARKFLIAAGSKALPPPIKGLPETGFLTHVEALKLLHQPKSLVILGAGAVGLEFAQMFARLGTMVTLVYRGDRILPHGEPELAERLEEIFKNEGVEILHQANVKEVRKAGQQKVLTLSFKNETRILKTEEILVGMGKTPNTDDLGLETAGVRVDSSKAIVTSETLETTVPNIYAAGDVTNLPLRLETTAGKEGTLAASNALTGSRKTINYRAVPATIFTDPQYSRVGLTDKEAVTQGYACSCRVVSFDKVPKAHILRNTDGIIKMVVDKNTKEILGVHVLAPHSGDFIFAAALAIQKKMTVDELLDLLPVFPTLSESLKIVGQSFITDIGKLSCCV